MNMWMIWKNSIKHHNPGKEDFYSHLNIENVTDPEY